MMNSLSETGIWLPTMIPISSLFQVSEPRISPSPSRRIDSLLASAIASVEITLYIPEYCIPNILWAHGWPARIPWFRRWKVYGISKERPIQSLQQGICLDPRVLVSGSRSQQKQEIHLPIHDNYSQEKSPRNGGISLNNYLKSSL